MDDEKRAKSETTNGVTPGLETAGAPGPINPKTGQHTSYWVLSEEERSKGFIRPVRTTYQHVGNRPKYPLRDLTDEEKARYNQFGYVKYEQYPDGEDMAGRYWAQKDLDAKPCNGTTTMGRAIAETYAREPTYYGRTFCAHCGSHFPVGRGGEFIWIDGSGDKVGT